MHYQLLGPMTVIHDDTEVTLGGLRQRGVLAALLLAAGRTVATDTLVEMEQDVQSSISYAGGTKLADIRKVNYVILGGDNAGEHLFM